MRHTLCFVTVLMAFCAPFAAAESIIAMASPDVMFVGGNEDSDREFAKVWFVPASEGQSGRVYTGFDDMFPQSGMNDKGLVYDASLMPEIAAAPSPDKPMPARELIDEIMGTCATVEDAVNIAERYDLSKVLTRLSFIVADPTGASAIFEWNELRGLYIIRNQGAPQILTNCRQAETDQRDDRFKAVKAEIDAANGVPSLDLFKTVLTNSRQLDGERPTRYACIYDPRKGEVHLAWAGDWAAPVTLSLIGEQAKGPHELNMHELFPGVKPPEPPRRARLDGSRKERIVSARKSNGEKRF